MTTTESQFFELLQAGLWGKEPQADHFPAETDWKGIYSICRSQALLGNVLDGMEMLPPEYRPERSLYLKWCAEVLDTEDKNRKLDSEVRQLFELLRSHGVEPVLMKGQGISRNYPNPLHRQCGDIDIYTGKKDYDKVNEILSQDGIALEKWSPKHLMFQWHNEIVENHRLIAKMKSPRADKNLERIVDEWFGTDKTNTVEIDGATITMPPLDFDVVFLLLHSVVHLFGYGIGLRQTCDWASLLHNRKDDITVNRVRVMLHELGLTNAARIFGALAVKYIGMPKEDLIIPYTSEDEEVCENLLRDIMHNGNFGHNQDGERTKRTRDRKLRQRIVNYFKADERVQNLKKIAPAEAAWSKYSTVRNFINGHLSVYKKKKI